jgi:hypothetical protein
MINVNLLENRFVIFQLPVVYGADVTALEDHYLDLQRGHSDGHVDPSDELYEGRPDVDPLTIFV